MKDKPEAARARNARRNDRLEESELEQVSVWVPRGKKQNIRDLAKSLRFSAGLLMPSDRDGSA